MHEPLLAGFAPIARADARLLILGSMPGAASLAANQYYAHPRNAFWPVIEAVWNIPHDMPYAGRVRAVMSQRIAIWDVLERCHRTTSLDADIDRDSLVVNDFASFLQRHDQIARIAFNGGAAESLYVRHVLPQLPPALRDLPRQRLPSTSPAHAALTLADKVNAWRTLRDAATGGIRDS